MSSTPDKSQQKEAIIYNKKTASVYTRLLTAPCIRIARQAISNQGVKIFEIGIETQTSVAVESLLIDQEVSKGPGGIELFLNDKTFGVCTISTRITL